MVEQLRTFRRLIVVIAAAGLLSAATLTAHHGWSNYGTEEFSLTGTVDTTVSYAGPHATMRVRADGQVWNIVMSAGNRVAAAGLKEGGIPVGSQVTVEGHRHRDPKVFEVKTERVKWNGKLFNVYPDRT
jgi:uncharacterized protein DUF6152